MTNCKHCSAEFAPVRVKQVYCSPACRKAAWHKANRSVPTADGVSPPGRSVARAVDAPRAQLSGPMFGLALHGGSKTPNSTPMARPLVLSRAMTFSSNITKTASPSFRPV